jgi:plastocyanin
MRSRARFPVAALGLIILLAACGGSPAASGSVECRVPVNGVLTVAAENLAFDSSCLALPAGEAVTIRFANDDTAPHDLVISEDSSGAVQLMAGEIIEGGDTIDYQVDPLEAGTFYFECTIHPAMNGSVVVE